GRLHEVVEALQARGDGLARGRERLEGRHLARRQVVDAAPERPGTRGSPRKKRRSAANASASPALAQVTTTGPTRRSRTRARHSAGALPRSPPTRTHPARCPSSNATIRATRSASDVCMALLARSALRSSAG